MTSKIDDLHFGLIPSEMEAVMNQEVEDNRTKHKGYSFKFIWRESLLKRHMNTNLSDKFESKQQQGYQKCVAHL